MKWYQKTWVIILFLIIFWPVGLVFMWKSNWNKITKIIVTIVIAMLFFVGCIGSSSKPNSTQINDNKIEEKNDSKADASKEEEEKKAKEEEEKKIKGYEEQYKPILESGKSYADMTNEEGDLALALVSNWDYLSDEFKSQYNDSKVRIKQSIDDYKNKKAKEEAEAKAAEEEAAYNSGITYDQLARTPDDYKGNKVTFTGKVIQVIEGNGETDLRVAVGGDYDRVILVAYDPKITSTRVLENDSVTIKGKSNGLYTYDSTIGGKITVPLILVDKIQINQ